MKALLLALALLLTPVAASAFTEQQAAMVASRVPACPALIGSSPGPLNGMYMPANYAAGWGYPSSLILIKDKQVSDEWGLLVLMHELGHCMQDEQGFLRPPQKELEFDADRRGVELAYQVGVNPIFLYDAFDYFVNTYRIDVNKGGSHGSIRERLVHLQKVIRTAVPPEAA